MEAQRILTARVRRRVLARTTKPYGLSREGVRITPDRFYRWGNRRILDHALQVARQTGDAVWPKA